MHDGDNDELVRMGDLLGKTKAKEPLELYGAESDEAFLAKDGDSHTDTGSLVPVKDRGSTTLKSRDEGAKPVAESPSDSNEFASREEDSVDPTDDDKMGADAQSVVIKSEHSDRSPTSTPKSLNSSKRQPAGAVRTEKILEVIVQRTVSHREGGGQYDQDVALQDNQEKHGDPEAQVDDVVFGVDHNDLDLSPQADHLSPMKDMQSLGNGDETLPTENTAERDDETTISNPVEPQAKTDSPSGYNDNYFEDKSDVVEGSKNDSPADNDDFLGNQPDDDEEVEAEEFETSHQDQDEGRLSVRSPFM